MTHCVRLHIRNVHLIQPNESIKTLTLTIEPESHAQTLKSKERTVQNDFVFLEDMEFYEIADIEMKIYESKKLLGVGKLPMTTHSMAKEMLVLNTRILDFNTSEKVGNIEVHL